MNRPSPAAARGDSPGPSPASIPPDPRVDHFVAWLKAHDHHDHRAAIAVARELRQLGVVVTVVAHQPGGRP